MGKTRRIHLETAVLEAVSSPTLTSLPSYGAELWALYASPLLVFYIYIFPTPHHTTAHTRPQHNNDTHKLKSASSRTLEKSELDI